MTKNKEISISVFANKRGVNKNKVYYWIYRHREKENQFKYRKTGTITLITDLKK